MNLIFQIFSLILVLHIVNTNTVIDKMEKLRENLEAQDNTHIRRRRDDEDQKAPEDQKASEAKGDYETMNRATTFGVETEDEDIYDEPQLEMHITGVKNLMACGRKSDNSCLKIKAFRIPFDHKFDCHQKGLKIKFVVVDGKTNISFAGFLPQTYYENSYIVDLKNKKTEMCPLIKRYIISDLEVLIEIGGFFIDLLNRTDVDQKINNVLWDAGYYNQHLAIKMGYYNEKEDKILIMSLLDVSRLQIRYFQKY